MERPNAWKDYTPEQLDELHYLCEGYKAFISDNKTERECCAAAVTMAEEAGYVSLASRIESGEPLRPGDKVYAVNRGKSLMLLQLGTEPLERGVNILGAHIDSPRLDVKQDPLEEKNELATLDTHYYGGIKKYQWVTMPLAIHGVVAMKDGSVVPVVIGEDEDDPVFCVTDLLPHLGSQQMGKKASEVIDGEMLDVLVGNRPLVVDDAAAEKDEDAEKSPVKAGVLAIMRETLGIEEEDLLSAELEIVPAGAARDLGLDRSMILGYGQDDRSCAYTSLVAQLDAEAPARTAVTLLVDKEEIGSVGATGMTSRFFEDTMAEVLELAGQGGPLALRRCLAASDMLFERRVRRLRPRVRERLRAEELRVPGPRPHVQQVHGQPRQVRVQRRRRRVRGHHPSCDGRGRRALPDCRARQGRRGRRRHDRLHPGNLRHERDRLRRAGALHARAVGGHEQGRHLRGLPRLPGVPEARVGILPAETFAAPGLSWGRSFFAQRFLSPNYIRSRDFIFCIHS